MSPGECSLQAEVIVAKRVEHYILGVDCSLEWLDIYHAHEQRLERITNTASSIEAFLACCPGPLCIGIEATNSFHERFVEHAFSAGHIVYLLDAKRLNRYRDAIGQRAKTDPGDAYLAARYVARERTELRPFEPLSAPQRALWRVLKRRASLVQAKTQLRQSLCELGPLKRSTEALLRHFDRLIALFERRLHILARELGWSDAVRRCQQLPGIGPLSALAIVAAFHRGRFLDSDAFVAFLGLDVRVRESGRFRGRRKLTKRGDPEARRLLYNAASAASRTAQFKPLYQQLLNRGLSSTAAFVAISRKLVRVLFALLRDGTECDLGRFNYGCAKP